MANASPSYIGAANGTNSTFAQQTALFLKVFSGEVITSFEKHTVCLDKVTVRTISAGKSAQFPVIGRMPDAAYHDPGVEITGQQILQNERVISIDKLLISHVFIADIDDAMSHFEVRSKYSQMMGQKLSETFDNHVMREIGQAALASATVTSGDGGYAPTADDNLKSGTIATKFTAWETAMFACMVNFDNKFVVGPRYCVLKPVDYYDLMKYVASNGFSLVNRDFSPNNGSYADGKLLKIAGIDLISTPMLPTSDYSAEAFHNYNCALYRALVFTPGAVGTVKLMDLSLQSEWDIRRQGTLMVARYAMGHGILQPECAALLRTAT
jgi:hypothetical protein